MKTYRVYAEYVQRVYIDVVAVDHEVAQDEALELPMTDWIPIDNKPLYITEVDYA